MNPQFTSVEFLLSQGFSATIIERFWDKVLIPENPEDVCWLWRASVDDYGYGQINPGHFCATPVKAHILSWILHFGPVPDGLCVCHTCDVPPCIRPDHLWLGTKQQNNHDRDLKGKHRCNFKPLPGELSGRSVLKEPQAIEIMGLLQAGNLTQQAIADRFGVTRGCVLGIWQKRSWRHLL